MANGRGLIKLVNIEKGGNMMPAGRPTKYKDEYVGLVYKFCLLGADDKDLARMFEVDEATINNWKIDHPEFFESLKAGKEEADAIVAQKLYHRATGYEHKDIQFATYQGEITDQVEYVKHYPPDTTAAIFWLKNRQSAKWRDKTDHEVSGPNGGPIQVAAMSDDELEKRLAELAGGK